MRHGRPTTARLPAPSHAPTIAGSRPATFAPRRRQRHWSGTGRSRSRLNPTCARAGSPAAPAARRERSQSRVPARWPAPRDRCDPWPAQRQTRWAPLPTLPTQAGWERKRRRLRRPEARFSAANTSLVETATPGLTSTANSRGRSSGADRTSPMPRIRRGFGSRHTGTSAPVACAACIRRGSSSATPLARARRRKAAAASAEPPPNPAATGKRFESAKPPRVRPAIRPASARAALSTRLSALSPAACAVGPLTASVKAPPGAKVKASPTPAKATRLSSS